MASSKILTWAFVIFCILALLTAPFVRADDEVEDNDDADVDTGADVDDDVDPTEVDIEDQGAAEARAAAEEVFTTYLFPDNADKKFAAGDKVTVLVAFQNRGESTYNLSAIGAHLHSPFDYNYYIQNYTYNEINSLIAPGTEGTVEYSFTPDKSLEALDFHLSILLYYNDTTANKFWRSTIFNGTVELTEKASEFTVKTLFTYILTAAVLGGVVFVAGNASGSLKKQTSGSTGRKSADAVAAAKSSWDVDEYKPKKDYGKKRSSNKDGSNKEGSKKSDK